MQSALRAFLLFYCHWPLCCTMFEAPERHPKSEKWGVGLRNGLIPPRLACIWSMALHLVDQKYPQWIDDIAASDALFGIVTRESPWRIYVTAFYFCSYTLTSVGYGDVGPRNILERVLCTGA